MASGFDECGKTARLAAETIWLIDLWNIKYRSKHLFGLDLKGFVRDISQEELRDWAIHNIKHFWIPMMNEGLSLGDSLSKSRIPLSKLVWTASGVARMLMLARGDNRSSKREALQWLAGESPDISQIVGLLSEEFEKPDCIGTTFTTENTHELGRAYLRLLHQAVASPHRS